MIKLAFDPILVLIAACSLVGCVPDPIPPEATDTPTPSAPKTDPMQIRLTVDGNEMTATLEDTPTARAFAEMLPLELTAEDYHGIEKIADLPDALPTDDAPAGIDPEPGDLAYYAPWGNLAIFYRDFGYAAGLVRLGSLDRDGDIDAFDRDSLFDVTLEPIEDD